MISNTHSKISILKIYKHANSYFLIKINKLQDKKYILWPVIKNINDLTFSPKSEKLKV